VAIIGMAGRFPGADNIDEFWEILRSAKETIKILSPEELLSQGVPRELINNPNYVRARGELANIDSFDAAFFGVSPREAELTDPQQRVFLECAWSALEHAGYDPGLYSGRIGVYAGTGWNSYLLFNLASHPGLLNSEAGHQILLGNEKDNLTTRVSYKLNLTGPSIDVQTGCSTSLVATCLAVQSLLSYQCDIALAGGVSISVPKTGYLYQPGGILSPDGHCRAFDEQAQGTVTGDGVGLVVLRRLDDALEDRDSIWAVVRAVAINNDGGSKSAFTAPSVDGQAEVIVEAQAMADVSPETISYVEAHGTATSLGDPIEIAALTKAFRSRTSKKSFCAIGSVKTNIGHLDAAAGAAGLIKTALALKHQEIPASLHFKDPNPRIAFGDTPFYVNTTLSKWVRNETPLRAGVSSFGLGGTNAHVILEEAPQTEQRPDDQSPKLLVLSARSAEGLERATANLVNHLNEASDINLGDVAYTLQVGRKAFEHRRMLVCDDRDHAVRCLETRDPRSVFTNVAQASTRPIAFMFSGQGTQYVNMARGLYEAEPLFRTPADICFDLLESRHDLDLRRILYPTDDLIEGAAQQLKQTEHAQTSLFVIEYALARMWMMCGVSAQAVIGHSLGEYVAATLAGVLSLEDALSLIIARARLMREVTGGLMLAIPLSPERVPDRGLSVSLAAINAPNACVFSGPADALAELQRRLSSSGIEGRYLNTFHAFHSQMMEPILSRFSEATRRVSLKPPSIPLISNLTGAWMTPVEAIDSDYWVKHMRQTVRFSDGLGTLWQHADYVLLEVGPGRTLSQFSRRHPDKSSQCRVLSSLRSEGEELSDVGFYLGTLGQLWLAGVNIDWPAVSRHRRDRRVPLPTYPFERKRYWIDPVKPHVAETEGAVPGYWTPLTGAVKRQAELEIVGWDKVKQSQSRKALDDLSLAYMNLTLRRLGAFGHAADCYYPDDLLHVLRTSARYGQLLLHWFKALVAKGHLDQDSEGMLSDLIPRSVGSVEAVLQRAKSLWTQAPYVIDLVQSCGEALVDVLRGEREPLELFTFELDEDGRNSRPELPLHRHYKAIMRTAVEFIAKIIPPFINLRILEIGGGTGIVTRELLPLLSPQTTSYAFTDIGNLFLSLARRKFSAYPFVNYGSLDIQKSTAAQGYPVSSFDVVIAVNVLHATRNIDQTLQNVRSLLAPNGLLLIWEISKSTLDFAITYGLLMDPVVDAERGQGCPFLAVNGWRTALLAHGFAKVEAVPNNDDVEEHVLIAQANDGSLGPRSDYAVTPAFTVQGPPPQATSSSINSLLKKPNIADWFYVPSWKRTTGLAQPAYPSLGEVKAESWLILSDSAGLGEQLTEQIELGGQSAIIVRAGSSFHRQGRTAYTINPQLRDDYLRLFRDLKEENKWPARIVHLWSFSRNGQTELTVDSVKVAQVATLQSLFFAAQAIGEQDVSEPLHIKVVSNNMQDVTGDETIAPEKALLLGPCKVIPLEYPYLNCTSIDVTESVADPSQNGQLLQQLMSELQSNSLESMVAFRGAYRWVQTFEPISLHSSDAPNHRLRKQGVYLITGGLGKIGMAVAEYFAATLQARLILVGRSGFPPPERWSQWLATHSESDVVSQRIEKLRNLESFGSEVLIMSADVAELKQMQAVVTRAQERFGTINGVIHSAGILGDNSIQRKTLAGIEEVLAPKVTGTLVLDHIFRGTSLDFFVLFSSLSANRPGFGQIAYSAANNFLDAFAHANRARGDWVPVCINWDVWQGDGMAYKAVTPLALRGAKEEDFRERGILPDEGMEVLRRILASGLNHVLVSSSDYLKILDTNSHDLAQLYLEAFKKHSRPSRHARPHLCNSYVAPSNETERSLAEIWQQLLGIEEIGIYDNFFELGGDSLIGTQLIARIKTNLGVGLPTKTVYVHPTIQSMAAKIEQTLILQASSAQINELIESLNEP
jgi:acyl transferase domain-containing protein/SAM-dependent methyltransferase/acyl carrier protein